MKIGKVIARVQHLYSRGVESDDSRLSDRLIWNKLITVRSDFLIKDYRKNRVVDDSVRQNLFLNMIKAENLLCGKTTSCIKMISEKEIPNLILDGENDICIVSDYSGLIVFDETEKTKVRYNSGNKYTKNKEQYYMDNLHLHIVNSRMKNIIINGIWEDPIKIHRLSAECLNTGYLSNQDIDFYTPSNLIDNIIEKTVEDLLVKFVQMKEDKNNDANED